MAVMLGTILLTMALLGYVLKPHLGNEARDALVKNLRNYGELLTGQIGTPPDFTVAARLSEQLRIGIAIRNPHGLWWFSPRVPSSIRERILSREALRDPARSDTLRVHARKGRTFVIIPQEGYTYVFGSQQRQALENNWRDWTMLFLGIGAVWLLAWLFIHRLLRPVRDLTRGVRAVESGELDTRIPVTGSGELEELANAFNSMASSLKERLQARDQLLLDVSHELRSPLTRMRVALEMAEPNAVTDSLREEVDALRAMVTDLLETERLKSDVGGLRREPADLNALVDAKVSRFAGEPPRVIRTGSPLPLLEVDAERLRLVLRNLIENALKYGTNPEDPENSRPVEVSTRVEDRHAVIAVRDFGQGVPEAQQRLIFEPFYRTDRSRTGSQGYGLGLPLCRRIVEAHGGTITFESKPGFGTTVTVRLPIDGQA